LTDPGVICHYPTHDAGRDAAERPGTDVTRLEQLRLDAGLTRNELGRLVGVHHATIRKIEDGRPLVHVAPLSRLSTYFGVKASELLLPAIGQATRAVDPDRAA
jgi:transcriptional regulator with XRE-family HTH domain